MSISKCSTWCTDCYCCPVYIVGFVPKLYLCIYSFSAQSEDWSEYAQVKPGIWERGWCNRGWYVTCIWEPDNISMFCVCHNVLYLCTRTIPVAVWSWVPAQGDSTLEVSELNSWICPTTGVSNDSRCRKYTVKWTVLLSVVNTQWSSLWVWVKHAENEATVI